LKGSFHRLSLINKLEKKNQILPGKKRRPGLLTQNEEKEKSMKEIKISTATAKDREQLIKWFKFYGTKELIEKRVDCYLGHNSTIIARDEDKITGVLQWHVKESAEHGLAEIEEVLVSESCRGKGTGSMLVTSAIETIRDYFIELNIRPRKIFLFVGKENTPARKLYEKHGFRLISSIGCLFSDNVEEVFYSLDMNS
jgi:ribosomal protein S18 acetylase RimI-like enzyme